jgi:hypothetical protein
VAQHPITDATVEAMTGALIAKLGWVKAGGLAVFAAVLLRVLDESDLPASHAEDVTHKAERATEKKKAKKKKPKQMADKGAG